MVQNICQLKMLKKICENTDFATNELYKKFLTEKPFNEDNAKILDNFKYKTLKKYFKKILKNT